jgi:predicted RNA methylase
MAERARAEVAAEQARLAEIASRGPLGRAAGAGPTDLLAQAQAPELGGAAGPPLALPPPLQQTPAAAGVSASGEASTPPTLGDQAAHQAATSHLNDLPEPTEPQKQAGNYQKGHVRYGGLDISIENPKGSKRSGVDPDGKPWEVEMSAHYGYIRGSKGKDGDQVDVYLASEREDTPVFVVDQVDPETRDFDEHKVMLGAASREEAEALYDAHFSDGSGPARGGAVTELSLNQFKGWLRDGKQDEPLSGQPLAPATPSTPSPLAATEIASPGASPAADISEVRKEPPRHQENRTPGVGISRYDEVTAKPGTVAKTPAASETYWERAERFKGREAGIDAARSAIASMVIHRASGQSFDEFLAQEPKEKLNHDQAVRYLKEKGVATDHQLAYLARQSDEEAKAAEAPVASPGRASAPTDAPGKDAIGPDPEIQSNKQVAEKAAGTGALPVPDVISDQAKAPLRIEALGDKSIIVAGDTKAHKDRIQALKGLWNGKNGGWVFPKKREAEVRDALGDLLAADARPGETWPPDGTPGTTVPPAFSLSDLQKSRRFQLVEIPVATIEAQFERDKNHYIGPGGSGKTIGERYQSLLAKVKAGTRILDAPQVWVDKYGKLSFADGRHRFALARDLGAENIQVAMEPEAVRNGQRAGILPTEKGEPFDTRLRDPETQRVMRRMATEAGWAQRGGELMRDENDNVLGRTTWLPREPWYAEIAERLSPPATVEAVRKATAGEKLGAKERRVVGYMLDWLDYAREEEALRVAETPPEDDAEREARAEREAIMAEAEAKLDALPDEDIEILFGEAEETPSGKDFGAEAGGSESRPGEADPAGALESSTEPGAQAGTDRDAESGPLLETYSAKDLGRREQARLEAEKRAAEEEAAAARKRQADRDREGFVLTGSDRVADELEARGQGSLLDQPGKPPPNPPPQGRGGQEAETPAPAGVSVSGEGEASWWPQVYREIMSVSARLRDLGEHDQATRIGNGWQENKPPIGFSNEAAARRALAAYREDLADAEAKARKVKPQEPTPPAEPSLSDESARSLYDEAQALFRKLPADMGKARREGKLTAAQEPARTEEIPPAIALAHALRDRILENTARITAPGLFKLATEAYGGTAAEGAYTSKDAYDALELGLSLARLEARPNVEGEAAERAVAILDQFEETQDRLPTPSKRSSEQVELQQYSTPHTHAHVMAWVANIAPGDVVLEPSAGTGNIVAQALLYGPQSVHANEISERRAALLSALGVTVTRENAAHIHALLPGLTPSVVLMNPPFSANVMMKGKKAVETGAEHVESALKKLQPGGRLVALLGRGMGFTEDGKPMPRFREWWGRIQNQYNVRAVYGIAGREYRKFGTEFDNALIVIDKTGPTVEPIAHGAVEKVRDLPALLEGIRNDRRTATAETDAARGLRAAGEPAAREQGGAESPQGARGEGSVLQRVRREVPGTADPVRLPVDSLDAPSREQPAGARPSAGREGFGRKTGLAVEASGRDAVSGAERQRSEGPDPVERSGTVPDGAVGIGDRADVRAQGQDVGDGGRVSGKEARGLSVSVEHATRASDALDVAAVYEQYRPPIRVEGAKPHPAILAESAAMASVKAPDPTYQPSLPQSIIDEGRLSDAQLVNVIQAGQAHGDFLPNGERRGYMIGDGTGVGKGAQIAGIIRDNWEQGRRRAVWISENGKLYNDAGRDIEWVGMDRKSLQLHNKFRAEIPLKEGVLFTTYDTVKDKVGGEKDATGKVVTEPLRRLDQLVNWLGEDFEGVIAFDEAHGMGNSLDQPGQRGVKKASAKALVGIELQKRLPKARIVYVSATAATNVEHLAYAERLGLWGEGTAFANKRDFIDKIKAGGVATMEVVAKDMKAMGLYQARNLAFAGVEQRELLHSLTARQTESYDEIARAWQIVLDNVNAVLESTGTAKNGQAKGKALAAFWGSQQRFFNQVLISLSVPTLIRDAEAQLQAGRSVVMQLVNTNEATQERRLAQAAEQEIDIGDIDINPRDVLMQYVQNGFPTQLYQQQIDAEGNETSTAVTDSQGKPVEDPEAVARRDALLEKLASLAVPEGVLEQIINHFGTDKVAEITGRSRRVVRKKDGTAEIERLSTAKSNKDADAFMQGKKRILIFSDAGGTGRSYHADLKSKNQEKRVHYLVQPGWRAEKAVQGLGRTHRTNQAHAPEYVLVTTNLKAQRRFMSSIARRLDQLGALTKGQRDTSSQGLFSAEMNLENEYGTWAIRSLMADMLGGRVKGLDRAVLEQQMGLYLIDPQTGQVKQDKLPTVQRFLNRMLALESETMDRVFDAFYERLQAGIEYAREQGTLDVGMETVTAQSVKKLTDTVVAGGEGKAETRYVKLALTDPVKFRQFDQLDWARKPDIARNRKSGKLYAFTEAPTMTDPNTGELVQRLRRVGVRDQKYVPARELEAEHYEILTDRPRAELRGLWDEEIAQSPQTHTEEMHLVTGALLPVWDRLPTDTPKVLRTQTDEGERLLGREIPPADLGSTLRALGAEAGRPDLTPAQMAAAILDDNATLLLANDWRIGRRVVSGEERIEVMGPTGGDISILRGQGAFTEIVAFRNRVFIPIGSSRAVIERITNSKPVVEVMYARGRGEESGARYSYLGEKAEKVPQHALAAARAYAEEGIPMEEIRKVTGWFRAKDGKWRFEISDAESTFRPGYRKGKTVGEVLDHPTLFDNYPGLADIGIVWRSDLPANVLGGYSEGEHAFHLNGNRTLQEIHSTLLHELQHGVQVIEGFARGGSIFDSAFIGAVAAMGIDVNDRDAVKGAYQRLLGEVEARDVQARADLTAEELRDRPPYVSQGIPESDFIVRRDGEFAAEEGPPGDTPSNRAGRSPAFGRYRTNSPFARGRAGSSPYEGEVGRGARGALPWTRDVLFQKSP